MPSWVRHSLRVIFFTSSPLLYGAKISPEIGKMKEEGCGVGCAATGSDCFFGAEEAADEDERAVEEEDEADGLFTPLCAFPASSKSGKP